jgi:hypothetical protein
MSYLTFGPEVKTVVLLNLPDSRTLQVVQFLYSAAILLSVPLQLFPAVRIMETGLFPYSGKANPRVKWTKNLFRSGIVMLCAMVAWAGAADLDKFVALIGSFACVPLCYVYPPMLHLKACARTRREKAADWALIVFGIVAAVYTTLQTLAVSSRPSFFRSMKKDAHVCFLPSTAHLRALSPRRWEYRTVPWACCGAALVCVRRSYEGSEGRFSCAAFHLTSQCLLAYRMW